MKIIFILIMAVVANASEFTAMEEACENKVAPACYEVGFLYETGVWVDKDTNKAQEYYMKSCEYGYDKACEMVDKSK